MFKEYLHIFQRRHTRAWVAHGAQEERILAIGEDKLSQAVLEFRIPGLRVEGTAVFGLGLNGNGRIGFVGIEGEYGVEDGLVEGLLVAKEGILTGQAGVVLNREVCSID